MTKTSKAKTHQCLRCGRTFARTEHLQRHERSHTKEKPFRCSLCSQAFTRKDLLTRHDRLVHQPQNQHGTGRSSTVLASTPSPPNANSLTSFQIPVYAGSEHLIPEHQLEHSHVGANALHLQSNAVTFTSEGTLHHTVYPDSHTALLSSELTYGASAVDIGDTNPYSTDYFASFLDSISFPNHPFLPGFQPLPVFSPDEQFPSPEVQPRHHYDTNGVNHDSEAPTVPISRFGSRLPSLQPDTGDEAICGESESRSGGRVHVFSKISEESREHIVRQLSQYSNVIPEGTVIPSRHALHRFISGYASVFHEHFPLLHLPTLSIETVSLELFLAIAALGAVYCREQLKALKLYHLAKSVALESLRRFDESHRPGLEACLGSRFNTDKASAIEDSDQRTIPRHQSTYSDPAGTLLQILQAIMLVIALSMWSESCPPAHDALSLRSLAGSLMERRVLQEAEDESNRTDSWEGWLRKESIKRTKLLIACFLNLLTIVFDVPPTTLFSDMTIQLPCHETEWRADTRGKWQEIHATVSPQPVYHSVFQDLLAGGMIPATSFSSLGGYGLIHGLIQHIWLLQQAARLPPRRERTLSAPEITSVEQALKRWRHAWEEDRESSNDPLSPHGRLSFNSAALLRLAYIRINIDSGSMRALSTWNPDLIAQSLLSSPSVHRSDKMTRAALHCAHGLSVPIKLGISFVAHTQVFFWSNQHALCSLECALLLTKWLEVVTVREPRPPLKHEEAKLLAFVLQMVAETEFDAPRAHLLENNRRLSATVVKIWAKLFRSDSIWEMVDLIGRSLRAYAVLLEQGGNLGQGQGGEEG